MIDKDSRNKIAAGVTTETATEATEKGTKTMGKTGKVTRLKIRGLGGSSYYSTEEEEEDVKGNSKVKTT